MAKFKVGDRVLVKSVPECGIPEQKGEIVHLHSTHGGNPMMVDVTLDCCPRCERESCCAYGKTIECYLDELLRVEN